MEIQDAHEAVKNILLELGGDKLIEGIGNVVYRAVTYIPHLPGQLNLSCFYFDVTLGDQYGKLSKDSRNYSVGLPIMMPLFAARSEAEQVAYVREGASKALDDLRNKIAKGEDQKLHEETPLGDPFVGAMS